MRPTIQLINALRKAADKIEDPNGGYCWLDMAQCNCGILAQEICGRTDLRSHMSPKRSGAWTTDSKTCRTTGAPLDDVFAWLLDAGLELDDFENIEHLEDKTVRERAGLPPFFGLGQSVTANVTRYFRAQADILEEQLGEQFESRPLNLSEIPNSSATPPLTQPGPGREVVR